eukprot:1179056-Prorocentrum_minimum.AAC.1
MDQSDAGRAGIFSRWTDRVVTCGRWRWAGIYPVRPLRLVPAPGIYPVRPLRLVPTREAARFYLHVLRDLPPEAVVAARVGEGHNDGHVVDGEDLQMDGGAGGGPRARPVGESGRKCDEAEEVLPYKVPHRRVPAAQNTKSDGLGNESSVVFDDRIAIGTSCGRHHR